jgi:HSP20 family protein
MLYPILARRGTTSVWDDIFNLRRQFDRLLEGGLGSGDQIGSAWMPPVDVRESGDELQVQVELPGMAPEDVEVRVENGVLTVSGEKKSEIEEGKNGGDYHLVERRYGRFERSFTLPRAVDADKVQAVFSNGVLTLSLPKAESAKPRRVEITAGDAPRIGRK